MDNKYNTNPKMLDKNFKYESTRQFKIRGCGRIAALAVNGQQHKGWTYTGATVGAGPATVERLGNGL